MTLQRWFQAENRPKGANTATSRQSRRMLWLTGIQVVLWTWLVIIGAGDDAEGHFLQAIKFAMLVLVIVLFVLYFRSWRVLKRWEARSTVDERIALREDGCEAFQSAADAPWNRCQRDVGHDGHHRDYFDREW